MKNFIVYDKQEKIRRTGCCQDIDFLFQAKKNEFIMEGKANGDSQKVTFDGFDKNGQPVNPRVVDKSPEEIEKDNPSLPEIPEKDRLAHITNEQWQDTLKRLDTLEKTDDTK